MSRHLCLIAFCAGLLGSAGCSSERGGLTPTGPSDTPPLEPPSASQRLAALALFESASLHAEVATSPLIYATENGKVWTNGPCAFGSGSLQGSLDGGVSPAPGTFLPTGSHTYVVSFNNCLAAWWGVELHGVASAAYSAAEWSNLTATVSADSVRGQGLTGLTETWDVTADGSALWTSVGSGKTTTYTPATGSRLVYSSTATVATFGGGSYSRIHSSPPQGGGSRSERRFDNLKVAMNSTQYTLHGSLVETQAFSGSRNYTGEIRITNNGTLVARIYGDVRNALTIEVLVPLVPL